MLSKVTVSPPWSLSWDHYLKLLPRICAGVYHCPTGRNESNIWPMNISGLQRLCSIKLLGENPSLNVFFSSLNVMIETMKNCMASQLTCPSANVSRKQNWTRETYSSCGKTTGLRERITTWRKILRPKKKKKKNTKTEIKLRPSNTYSLCEASVTLT